MGTMVPNKIIIVSVYPTREILKKRDNRRTMVVPHKPDPSGCVHECAEFPRF